MKFDVEKTKQILHLTKQQRLPVPDNIANAPKLFKSAVFYNNAFWRLDSERSSSFTLGRIPWSKIIEYGKQHDLDKDGLWMLEYVISRVDNQYLAMVNKNGKSS